MLVFCASQGEDFVVGKPYPGQLLAVRSCNHHLRAWLLFAGPRIRTLAGLSQSGWRSAWPAAQLLLAARLVAVTGIERTASGAPL